MIKKFNQNGLGLIQVIVVSAVLLIALMVSSRLIGKQTFLTSLRTNAARAEIFAENLKSQLEDPEICSAALSGNVVSYKLDKEQTLSAVNMSFAGDPGPIVPKWKSNSLGIQISNISLVFERQASLPPTNAQPNPGVRNIVYDWPNLGSVKKNSYLKFYGKLYFHFSNTNWNPFKEGRGIELVFSIDSSNNRIYQCHGLQSIAEGCEIVGGSYDSSANSPPELRCNPDIMCFNNSIGLVTDSNLCKSPYKAVGIGVLSGKPNYLCSWCNRNH